MSRLIWIYTVCKCLLICMAERVNVFSKWLLADETVLATLNNLLVWSFVWSYTYQKNWDYKKTNASGGFM